MMSLAGYFINITSSVLSFFFIRCLSLSRPPPSLPPPRLSFLHLLSPALPSIHLTPGNPLTLPSSSSSSSSTPLLISPLLSSLLLYQSHWQKINISSAAAFLPFLPRPSLLTLGAHLLVCSRILSKQEMWLSISSLRYR